jgi:hypothetical protein
VDKVRLDRSMTAAPQQAQMPLNQYAVINSRFGEQNKPKKYHFGHRNNGDSFEVFCDIVLSRLSKSL